MFLSIRAWSRKGRSRSASPLTLDVDHARRSAIRANHSATHLLHEALRQVLGDHVAQKGSLVAPERLRFDISHPKPIRREELERVEDIVNDIVLQNAARHDPADGGGRRHRVRRPRAVRREIWRRGPRRRHGRQRAPGGNALGWSVELCGGTHVRRTGDIGLVSVVGESAVGAGVRRIEALTGRAARAANHVGEVAKAGAVELKVQIDEMPERIAALMDERKRLERDLADTRRKLAMGGGAARRTSDGVRQVGDVKLLARAVSGIEIKDLKSLADDGKKQVGSGVVAIVGVTEDGKAGLVVGVTPTWWRASVPSIWCAAAPKRSAAKAAAAVPTWPRPAALTAAKAEAALDAVAAAIGGG